MSRYVIKRTEDGYYVAPSGLEHAYTPRLERARTFSDKAKAQAECCGNEFVANVEDLINLPDDI